MAAESADCPQQEIAPRDTVSIAAVVLQRLNIELLLESGLSLKLLARSVVPSPRLRSERYINTFPH